MTLALPAASASARETSFAVGFNGKCLQAGPGTAGPGSPKVVVWDCNGSLAQEWYMDGHGAWRQIRSAATGLCLEADLNSISRNGTVVLLSGCDGRAQQGWVPRGRQIFSYLSGRVLDADSTQISQNGAKVQLWSPDQPPQPQQQWFGTVPTAEISPTRSELTVPDGRSVPTTISWTGPGPETRVVMSTNGGPQQTVATGSSGSQTVPISQGQTVFAVVWGVDPSESLATVAVSGISPDPPLCGLTPAGPTVSIKAGFRRHRHLLAARAVRLGQRPLVTGTVSDAGGAPAVNQPLCVLAQTATGVTRQPVAMLHTDSAGHFVYRVRSGPSRTLSFAVDTAFGPVFAKVRLGVHARISLVPSRRNLQNEQRLRLVGRLSGPVPRSGAVVVFQVWRADRHSWQAFEWASARSDGMFRGTWRFTNTHSSADYLMRALVPSQPRYPYLSTVSRVVTIHVTG